MTKYTTDNYRIDIYSEQTFTESSADNFNQYDFIYFDKSKYDFPSAFGIKIFEDDKLIKSAVIGSIGGGTDIHDTSTIIEKDRILICCADTIFCLSIPDLSLVWQTIADQATCFEIYKYQDNYIVHGELEISRLDKDGKILWQQSGADIFTTLDGKDNFELKDTYILATDFENRIYKISYNGQLII